MTTRILFLAFFLLTVWLLYHERAGGRGYISRIVENIVPDVPLL